MTPFFRPNVKIEKVERAGRLDRYGVAQREVVATEIRGRLERATRRVRNVQGDTTTIDGSILIPPSVLLETDDRLVLENGEQWVVFNVDESLDAVQGRVLFRTYGLTKQRERQS